jgi:hypothetical protein
MQPEMINITKLPSVNEASINILWVCSVCVCVCVCGWGFIPCVPSRALSLHSASVIFFLLTA